MTSTSPLSDDERKKRKSEHNKAYCKAYYAANKEREKARSRAKHAANRDARNAQTVQHRRTKKYGITPDQYAEMLASQDNACAICRSKTPQRKDQDWAVDHCHGSGRVRGILCHPCNLMLGHARDNVTTLSKAIEYLER